MKEEAGGIFLCVVKLIRRRIVKEKKKKKDGDLVSESIGPKPQPKQKAQ